MKNLLLFNTIILFVVFSSCESKLAEEISVPIEEISRSQDFPDIPTYNTIEDINMYLSTLSDPTARVESNSNLFDYHYEQVIDRFAGVETEDELFAIIDKYSDIVYYDEAENSVEPVIQSPLYRRIVNSEGLYKVEDFIHKFIENRYVVYGNLDLIDQIRTIKSIDQVDTNIFTIVDVYPKHGNMRIESCNNPEGDVFTKNKSGCKNDRRVILNAEAETYVVGSGRKAPFADIYIEAKKKLACAWIGYKTTIYSRNTDFNIQYSITGNIGDIKNTTIYYGSYSWGNVKDRYISFPLGHLAEYTTSNPSWAIFADAHTEARTTGTGSNGWAIIDCQ